MYTLSKSCQFWKLLSIFFLRIPDSYISRFSKIKPIVDADTISANQFRSAPCQQSCRWILSLVHRKWTRVCTLTINPIVHWNTKEYTSIHPSYLHTVSTREPSIPPFADDLWVRCLAVGFPHGKAHILLSGSKLMRCARCGKEVCWKLISCLLV